jgi:hypothetical protein
MAILCIWVHGYDHLVGNQQGQGYGRLMLDAIEAEARAAGLLGVAAWGMDFPYWNPVSFYEHMGYARVDQEEMAVLVWKAFDASATPPAFHRQRRELVARGDRIPVHLFLCGWCTGACSTCVTTREALEGLDEVVAYEEIDTLDPDTLRTWGISDGLYVDGQPYRPDEPPHTAEQLRQDLVRLARDRGLRTSSDA